MYLRIQFVTGILKHLVCFILKCLVHQVHVLTVDNSLRPRLFENMVSPVIKVINTNGNYSQINLIHFVVRQSNNIE